MLSYFTGPKQASEDVKVSCNPQYQYWQVWRHNYGKLVHFRLVIELRLDTTNLTGISLFINLPNRSLAIITRLPTNDITQDFS